MTKINFISLFPDFLKLGSEVGVVGSAVKSGQIQVQTINPRDFTTDVHHSVDDKPFGGGDGMLMMCEPIEKALKVLPEETFVIYLSPQGQLLDQSLVLELSKKQNLTLICGRYAGLDQRFINEAVDLELSIGDYVLSGGELAGLVVLDAVARQLEGVLGHKDSALHDSLSNGLLEAPQFTRPREYFGQSVPETLLSGHHKNIQTWKEQVAVLNTLQKRPDLLSLMEAPKRVQMLKQAHQFYLKMLDSEKKSLGFTLTDQDFHQYGK